MLTPATIGILVTSAGAEADQGEISGLSRSVSNLGSSFGTALVGSVLVAVARPAGEPRQMDPSTAAAR